MSTFSVPLREAGDALRAGDRDAAWQTLRKALSYPTGVEMSDAEFAQSLGMLELIGNDSFSAEAKAAFVTARHQPGDPQVLYDLGYHLIESKIPLVAATALARGNALAPDVPAIVNELVHALESSGLHFDAYLALQQAWGARQQDWFSRYLYAFNAFMSGHVSDARQAYAELGEPADEHTRFMQTRLESFFARHKKMAGSTTLNEQDLRGWHYTITAGVLTHVSPHGFDEGMNGRYAMVQDQNELIHEGVLRAVAVLQAWETRPQRLIYSNDRSSEILAQVWKKRLGIAIKPFEAADVSSDGLFLAYDVIGAEFDFLQALEVHRPGQIFVTHASCWTEEFSFTSDISTFQYQTNTAPWGAGRMRLNPETNQTEQMPADLVTPADALADRIVASEVTPEALQDLDQLTALARAAGPPAKSGRRAHFFFGSPVSSARFM